MSQTASERAVDELLHVDDIEVIYDGAILAVAGVSLTVPKGGIVALLGANGAGKSTTLKAISGLVRAERAQVSRGTIRFLGQDTASVDPSSRVRQGMVHVLEGTSVALALTAADRIQQTLDLPTRAFTYLRSHGELDKEHINDLAGILERFTDDDDRQAVIRCARGIYWLYGQVFRSLDVQPAVATLPQRRTA